MKIELDTLKQVKQLEKIGVAKDTAEAILTVLSEAEIRNIYNKHEVDNMLSETVEKVFREQRREFDQRMADNRDAFDQCMATTEKRLDKSYQELKASNRWLITTIIAAFGILVSLHLFH